MTSQDFPLIKCLPCRVYVSCRVGPLYPRVRRKCNFSKLTRGLRAGVGSFDRDPLLYRQFDRLRSHVVITWKRLVYRKHKTITDNVDERKAWNFCAARIQNRIQQQYRAINDEARCPSSKASKIMNGRGLNGSLIITRLLHGRWRVLIAAYSIDLNHRARKPRARNGKSVRNKASQRAWFEKAKREQPRDHRKSWRRYLPHNGYFIGRNVCTRSLLKCKEIPWNSIKFAARKSHTRCINSPLPLPSPRFC